MSDTNGRPRRALLFGGSGQIGHFLLPRLASAPFEVVALTRNPDTTSAPRHHGVQWRLLPEGRLDGALAAGERFDVVFHLAPLPGLPPLVDTLASHGVQRLIAFGTTSRFYKLDSRDASERRWISSFRDAEMRLADACGPAGIQWTLFRPTMVYGGGTDANVALIARVARLCGVFPLMQGGRGLRQPVHAEDLAIACVQAMDERVTYGRAYDLSGGETLSYRAMVERIFTAIGRRPRLVDVPLPLFRFAMRLAQVLPAFRGISPEAALRQGIDLCFDHASATMDFGYAPRAFAPDATALPR